MLTLCIVIICKVNKCQKKRPATEPVITKLIIPKKTFKEELKSQCEKGKEIIGVPIQKPRILTS